MDDIMLQDDDNESGQIHQDKPNVVNIQYKKVHLAQNRSNLHQTNHLIKSIQYSNIILI